MLLALRFMFPTGYGCPGTDALHVAADLSHQFSGAAELSLGTDVRVKCHQNPVTVQITAEV